MQLPVRMHGIQLARPVAALVDARADRIVGLEILCGDGAHRFLPFAVAEVREDEIAVESALTLLEEADLAFYRPRTRSLADLGIDDPWVGDDGAVHDPIAAG